MIGFEFMYYRAYVVLSGDKQAISSFQVRI
jgi:hypothetical protein